MMTGGVARRLVDFAVALIGFLRGGLAASTVLTSMLFATISGSSAATAAAIGSTLIPEMERKKYPRPSPPPSSRPRASSASSFRLRCRW